MYSLVIVKLGKGGEGPVTLTTGEGFEPSVRVPVCHQVLLRGEHAPTFFTLVRLLSPGDESRIVG